MLQNIYGLTPNQLNHFIQSQGFNSLHVKGLLKYLYSSKEHNSASVDALPHKLTEHIKTRFSFEIPSIYSYKTSEYDGSVKFLVQMSDQLLVETVLMPETSRITLCLSSQIGCQQACSFCNTGRMGLSRNLESHEIIGQILTIHRWIHNNPQWLVKNKLPLTQTVTNIVFMGMGEPLDNLEHVVNSIEIMKSPCGLNLAPKRITVSTAGHLEGLKSFLSRDLGVAIALSLHTSDSQLRSKLMPINRRFPIQSVLEYLESYFKNSRRKPLIQYTLISQVNDRPDDAINLIKLISKLNPKVNLIPLNPFEKSSFAPPDPERLKKFQSILSQNGIRTMVRFSKGQDISAGCGQLVTS